VLGLVALQAILGVVEELDRTNSQPIDGFDVPRLNPHEPRPL